MRAPDLLVPVAGAGGGRPPAAVLFDRDGTLVVDVPYNGDPDLVVPVAGAREALDRLRSAGVALAVVSNQSGVARGLLTRAQVDAVNARVEELLGPLGPFFVCPHAPDGGCACRKPAPGLVLGAARALGVDPARCAVVGDIGADVGAARAAGARAVLVPTAVTRPCEVADAPEVAADLAGAVDLLLGAARTGPAPATPGRSLPALGRLRRPGRSGHGLAWRLALRSLPALGRLRRPGRSGHGLAWRLALLARAPAPGGTAA